MFLIILFESIKLFTILESSVSLEGWFFEVVNNGGFSEFQFFGFFFSISFKSFLGLFDGRSKVKFGELLSNMFSSFSLSGRFNFVGIFLINFFLFGSLEVISPNLELFSIISFVSRVFVILFINFFSFNLLINIFLCSFLSESHTGN